MKFRILRTHSSKVQFADSVKRGWVFDPKKGVWWLDLNQIESVMEKSLRDMNPGDTVEEFVFGFELGSFAEGFDRNINYSSWRPKLKIMLSVGVMDWDIVKHLSATEQFEMFRENVLESCLRFSQVKRKPKNFDFIKLHDCLKKTLSKYSGTEFSCPLDFKIPSIDET